MLLFLTCPCACGARSGSATRTDGVLCSNSKLRFHISNLNSRLSMPPHMAAELRAFGVMQMGGELTDLLIVLRTKAAVVAFCSTLQARTLATRVMSTDT